MTNSTEPSMEQLYGGIIYLHRHPEYFIPVIFYSIITVNGIIGNMLIIISIIMIKDMHTTANLIIMNLSLIDFLLSLTVDTFTIAGILVGSYWFNLNFPFCRWIAANCLILCAGSVFNIGLLAVNRYIHICHHQYYNKIFTIRKTVAMCIGIWVMACFIDLPNSLGWGGHIFDKKLLVCAWNRLANHSYSIFFSTSSIYIPCLLVLLCYLRIFWYVWKSEKKVESNTAPNAAVNKKSERAKSIKLAKSLFTTFIVFTICWVPYATISMIDKDDKLPAWMHSYSGLLAHANSALNPMLYAKFNPIFMNAYKQALNKITFNRCCKGAESQKWTTDYTKNNNKTNQTNQTHTITNTQAV